MTSAADFFRIEAEKVVLKESAPFFKVLSELFTHEDPELREHVHRTVTIAEAVVRHGFSGLASGGVGTQPNLAGLWHSLCDCLGARGLDDHHAEVLKLAALFHDIGKCIEKDNHPQIGLYVVRDFFPQERTKLELALGTDDFALLCSIIRHHDKFGVAQTGEASLSVFADIPYYASCQATINGVQKNLAFVCLCNLMDMAASGTGSTLSAEAIDRINADWLALLRVVADASGERERLKQGLILEDCKSHRAIERIKRLLRSATREFHAVAASIDESYLNMAVPQALQTSFDEFARCLAHIAKLDYGLRFFRRLTLAICRDVVVRHGEHNPPSDAAGLERVLTRHGSAAADSVRDQVTIKILKILERFVLRYRWILAPDGAPPSARRIGYEMSGVIGEGKERISDEIISCLIQVEKEPAGLNWIVDKTPIWSLD